MAIDTRAKRLSMLNAYGEGISQRLLPDPSGVVDAAARSTFLDLYGGLGGAPPVVVNTLQDKFTLGTEESLSMTTQPTVGGRWSW